MKSIHARNLFIALMFALSLAETASGAQDGKWSYSGATGPAKWAKLDKGYAACAEGQFQSPIDIPDSKVRKGDFPSMLFNYRPAPLTVLDDGHTIVAKIAPGSGMTLDGVHYDLTALEFHKPSEIKVNGKAYEMQVDLVHKTKDGKLVILAVPLDAGKESPAMKAVLANLPPVKGKEIAVPAVTINAVDFLPANKDYYGFTGSLTTPPCTENVEWIALKAPGSLSADQIARFGKLYPMNARPVQPFNGRDMQSTH